MEFGFYEKDPILRDDYNRFTRLCKDNLEVALANLNILMSATMESIEALILGVSIYSCITTLSLTSIGTAWN